MLNPILSPLFWNNTCMSDFLRDQRCCTTLLKYVTEDGLFALDLKKDVGVIAIAFSKTFDSVWHNLLAKLRAYGCQESAIRLTGNGQINTIVYFKIVHLKMQWVFLNRYTCGVSQGRLLVRKFCTRNPFLLCRKYLDFSRLKYELKRTLCQLQICLRRSLKFFSSRHLYLWTRKRFLTLSWLRTTGPLCLQLIGRKPRSHLLVAAVATGSCIL